MDAALAPTAAEAIRSANLRVTGSRIAVFDALASRPHARAEHVFDQVRPGNPRASMQSVYNALRDFEYAGLVRRIEPAGHPMLFELRVSDNHHHLICTVCGAVEDVECAVGHAPCLTPSDSHGFAVSSAEVTYWGTCAECAGTPSNTCTS